MNDNGIIKFALRWYDYWRDNSGELRDWTDYELKKKEIKFLNIGNALNVISNQKHLLIL